jgi:hypothetical protein
MAKLLWNGLPGIGQLVAAKVASAGFSEKPNNLDDYIRYFRTLAVTPPWGLLHSFA